MAAFSNNVNLNQPRETGYSPRQTQGAYNFQQAQAFSAADPRMNMKGLDRPGVSRGSGQQGYAAAAAANAYANGMQNAESIPIQDASYNANTALQQQASRDQMAQQYAASQDQMRQQQAMFNLSNRQNTLGLLAGLLG